MKIEDKIKGKKMVGSYLGFKKSAKFESVLVPLGGVEHWNTF